MSYGISFGYRYAPPPDELDRTVGIIEKAEAIIGRGRRSSTFSALLVKNSKNESLAFRFSFNNHMLRDLLERNLGNEVSVSWNYSPYDSRPIPIFHHYEKALEITLNGRRVMTYDYEAHRGINGAEWFFSCVGLFGFFLFLYLNIKPWILSEEELDFMRRSGQLTERE